MSLKRELKFFKNYQVTSPAIDNLIFKELGGLIYDSGEKIHYKWIEESTIELREFNDIIKSTYIRWALAINGLNLGHEKYNKEDFKGKAFAITSARFVQGDITRVNIMAWNGTTAAQYFTDTLYLGHTNVPPIANTTSTERITIANHFVQIAIASKDLGIKAVGYCSALETLFSNGENTELAHKLSERIAKFLEKDLNKRTEIYKSVKKIYEIRSKVVHGATIRPAKLEELSTIVKEADEICRRIMVYAFTVPNGENIFEKSRESLDQYFSELILA